MFRQAKIVTWTFIVFTLLCVIVCDAWLPAEAKIKFGGKPIDQVANVMQALSGRANFQVGKKSLLFTERAAIQWNSNPYDLVPNFAHDSYTQSRIFWFNEDGSVQKEFTFSPFDGMGELGQNNTADMTRLNSAVSNRGTASGYVVKTNSGNSTIPTKISLNTPLPAKPPIQTFPRSVSGNQVSLTQKTISTNTDTTGWVNVYGSGTLTFPNYDGEVFVATHSDGKPELKQGNGINLNFTFLKYDQDGNLTLDFEKDIVGYDVDDRGLINAYICTGDFDNDGYENEIAALIFLKNNVIQRVFHCKYDDSKKQPGLSVIYSHSWGGGSYSTDVYACGGGNVFAGDFDGDGLQEIGYIIKFTDYSNGQYILRSILKWDDKSLSFHSIIEKEKWKWEERVPYVHGVAADLNGDGVDEFVMVKLHRYYIISISLLLPQVKVFQYNGFDGLKELGNFEPVPLDTRFGKDNDIDYYPDAAISVAAGPFRGKFGKDRIVDDLAISFTKEAKAVWLVPAPVNDNGDFDFKSYTARKIYDSNTIDQSIANKKKDVWTISMGIVSVPVQASGYFTGGLAVADFLAEGIELRDAEQLCDTHDTTYAAILPAIPYHVDNLTVDGTALTDYPTNFSFSGFKEATMGGGEMSVTYMKSATSSESSTMKFSTTTTLDTMFDTGGNSALEVVDKYLEYNRITSHLAANFGGNSEYGQAGAVAAKFLDFFNNHTNTVKTKMDESSNSYTLTSINSATDRDAVLLLDTTTYTWRYRILSNYPPTWLGLQLGGNINANTINENPVPDSSKPKDYYITFSIRDDIVNTNNPSTVYQPRHEEGNLFSYPARIEDAEGYNDSGKLMDNAQEFVVPNTNDSEIKLSFSNANRVGNQATQTVTPSEATKTVSFVKGLWNSVKSIFTGKKSSSATPAQTENSAAYTKSYATDESIAIKYWARTTLPMSSAGYSFRFMPYVAKEGTMKVAASVKLDTNAANNYYLWNQNSLYRKYPDPALLLPDKYVRNGSTFVTQTNHIRAMQMRGVRIYSQNFGAYSDLILIPNMTYRIEIPMYNASFIPANGVRVRLSYSNKLNPEVKQDSSRTLIDNKTVSINGWANETTTNHAVVNFEWKVPTSLADGNYYFYVDVDPDNAITEVHESRMKSSTEIADCGGNNEGFFPFSVMHLENVSNTAASSVRATDEPDYNDLEVLPWSCVRITFNGSDSLISILDDFHERKLTSPDDPVVFDCEVTNLTSTNFGKVILYGFNLVNNENQVSQENDELQFLPENYKNAFLRHEFFLFPNDTTKFTFAIKPSDVEPDDAPLIVRSGFLLRNVPREKILGTKNDPDYEDVEDEEEEEIIDENGSGSSERIGSSGGGGCELGFGSLMMLSLMGFALLRKK